MAKQDDFIEARGIIEETLPAGTFRVKLENNQFILGHTSGKMRQNKIQILAGDHVQMELSPYDLTKGRIVYREK